MNPLCSANRKLAMRLTYLSAGRGENAWLYWLYYWCAIAPRGDAWLSCSVASA